MKVAAKSYPQGTKVILEPAVFGRKLQKSSFRGGKKFMELAIVVVVILVASSQIPGDLHVRFFR